MKYWQPLGLQQKVLDILDVHSHNRRHHFRRPFLTSYQIAIEFHRRYPQDCVTMGKEVGGRGAGDKHSLSQYFALELSKRIKNGSIGNVQGGFLHRRDLTELTYEDNNRLITSSASGYDLSMFRLLD
jgi:hypothetical protein